MIFNNTIKSLKSELESTTFQPIEITVSEETLLSMAITALIIILAAYTIKTIVTKLL
jgi:hypothetical protein